MKPSKPRPEDLSDLRPPQEINNEVFTAILKALAAPNEEWRRDIIKRALQVYGLKASLAARVDFIEAVMRDEVDKERFRFSSDTSALSAKLLQLKTLLETKP